MTDSPRCLACNVLLGKAIAGFADRVTISSDCKPIGSGFEMLVCPACGLTQKLLTAEWHSAVEEIYRQYEIYPQGGGIEQVIFSPTGGGPSHRSLRLIDKLKSTRHLPESGCLLDVGCGNGGLLRSCAAALSGWKLAGSELHDSFRDQIMGIAGVEKFYAGDLSGISDTFDVITLVHVLEHISQPRPMLEAIRRLLADDGVLLIQVPYLNENPFDLIVADHCSHFVIETLLSLLRAAGYRVEILATDWVPKEITIVARAGCGDADRSPADAAYELARTSRQAAWLGEVVAAADSAAQQQPLGIFGTSIAGTWLAAELGDRAGFFVDEDETRVGRQHLGKNILTPSVAPDEANLYLAFPRAIADRVHNRLQTTSPRLKLMRPPALVPMRRAA